MPLLPAAIGIILNDDESEILLVKRSDVPIWVLPGGGIEPREKAEEAVKREIFEETGYRVKIQRKCAEYSPINRLASSTTIFLCKIESGSECLSRETAEIAFFPLEKLPTSFFPFHRRWLQEALTQPHLIRRPLNEVSYSALFLYFLNHPWQVLRFAWTRLMKT